ncbi:MAG: molybdenum cofactor biosynthesis protein [Deltaproteobacteria bacterium]|nr:molybdenum cofactor biosynthesis protein [Deltaproteobacteria bacterium]
MRDMLDREELLPVEKALKLLLNYAPFKIPVEVSLPIDESYKMVISRDITSPEDLPSFSRSTVDGFAVNSSDTFGATESMPSYLTIIAEILMGERPEFGIKKGECAKIATGGMLPEGADSVVMFEHTQQIDGKMLEILKPVSPGENVIPVGEDARRDECILRTGHWLRPQDIGVLAGLGITEVWVYERPRVSIVSTGDEIVPADKSVKPGQVRDINSYTLSGLISDSGGIPVKKGIFSDRYEIIKDVVDDSLKSSDMVLISGGSSVGTKDVTSKVIDSFGKPGVLFHGVSLKPGKPMIGGVIGDIPIFGLPGHPAAVNVCFEVFIRPVLEIQSGCKGSAFDKEKRTVKARIAKNISSSPGREEHIGVTLEERNGELWAIPLLGKSGLITTLTRADGTGVIPLRKLGVQEGEFIEVRLF